jgi:hypothetical protein
MNATIYWTRHKLQQGTRELRWAAKLWWFKQEIDFLDWRWRMESHLPAAAVPATSHLTAQGGTHAMRPLPLLHG